MTDASETTEAELALAQEKLRIERERLLLERERLDAAEQRITVEKTIGGLRLQQPMFSLTSVVLLALLCLVVGVASGIVYATHRAESQRTAQVNKIMQELAASALKAERVSAETVAPRAQQEQRLRNVSVLVVQ